LGDGLVTQVDQTPDGGLDLIIHDNVETVDDFACDLDTVIRDNSRATVADAHVDVDDDRLVPRVDRQEAPMRHGEVAGEAVLGVVHHGTPDGGGVDGSGKRSGSTEQREHGDDGGFHGETSSGDKARPEPGIFQKGDSSYPYRCEEVSQASLLIESKAAAP
jgi:hypothetical protein